MPGSVHRGERNRAFRAGSPLGGLTHRGAAFGKFCIPPAPGISWIRVRDGGVFRPLAPIFEMLAMVSAPGLRRLACSCVLLVGVFSTAEASEIWGLPPVCYTYSGGYGHPLLPFSHIIFADPALLPYESDAVPYFDRFPVIEVSATSAPRWARFLYRSDFARYGEQWDRSTWDIYRRIALGLRRGEIIRRPAAFDGARLRGVGKPQEGPSPIRITNPFVMRPSSSTPSGVGAAQVTFRRGSSGPPARRIANPFATPSTR